jgi:hypothetical protein
MCRTWRTVPARGGQGQAGARPLGAQRPHHHPGRGELLLHPGHAHRDVLGRQAEGGDDLAAVKLARGFQPPQREQFLVARVEPAAGLCGLLALARQAQAQDGQVDEVSRGIGHLIAQVGHGRRLPGPVVIAHLADGHGDQPGPERGGITQAAKTAHGAEHGFLHHVVHIGVPAQRPAHDVVDQRQVAGQQVVERLCVSGLSGQDRLHAWPAGSGHVPDTSRSSGSGRVLLHLSVETSRRRAG